MTDQNDSTTDTTNTTPPAGENQPPAGDQPTDAAGLRKALEAERKARRDAEQKAAQLGEQVTAYTRQRIAREKGLSEHQAKFLAGKSEEEMAAHADELLQAFVRDEEPRRRPREKLRSGAAPDSEEPNFGSVADQVFRRR